jgi:hypothetical protein
MHLRADAFDGTAVGPLNKPLSDASPPSASQPPASQTAASQPASPQPASQPPASQPANHIMKIIKNHPTSWKFRNTKAKLETCWKCINNHGNSNIPRQYVFF